MPDGNIGSVLLHSVTPGLWILNIYIITRNKNQWSDVVPTHCHLLCRHA